MSPDSCLSIHMYLRILCKIHVSGSVYKSMSSDSCLSIFISIYISGSSAGSMSPDSCLSIFVSQDSLQDPCPAEIRGSVSRRRNANFDLRRRVLCGPAQGKQSDRVFRAGETQILTCRDAFFVALRRRNANLTSQGASCVHIMWIHEESRPDERKSPRRYSETQKKNPSNRFAQAKRKFWPPRSRFLWPCAVKNDADKNLHLDLRGLTLTVRTSQCATLFGEKNKMK